MPNQKAHSYLHPTNAAWLRLNTIEADGWTNLNCGQGTISMWFAPDWQSGGGPGVWGRLFEVGAWSSDASNGWWSLYFDAGGTNIFFSAQENGVSTNYLWAPISWESNAWRFIALSYSSSNSSLYLDGQLAASGSGVSVKPRHEVFTNGFLIGGDETGLAKAQGLFEHVRIWDLPLSAAAISNHYLGMISKKGTGTDLVTSQYGVTPYFKLTAPKDGSPVRLDLFKRKISPKGQLEVQTWLETDPVAYETKSWRLKLSVPGGGLIEHHDEFPYHAPEGGYRPFVEFTFPGEGGGGKPGISHRKFYIVFGQPPNFGRIDVSATGRSTDVIVEYAVNPDGSRNLEGR